MLVLKTDLKKIVGWSWDKIKQMGGAKAFLPFCKEKKRRAPTYPNLSYLTYSILTYLLTYFLQLK